MIIENSHLNFIKKIVREGLLVVTIFIVVNYVLFKGIDFLTPFTSKELESKLWGILENKFYQAHYLSKEHERLEKQLQAKLDNMPYYLKPERYQDIQIMIITSNQVNAFALFDGHIVLTTALVDKIQSENGLMFVIGHEIGHLQNLDHLNNSFKSLIRMVYNSIAPEEVSYIQDLLYVFDEEDLHSKEYLADAHALYTLQEIYGHTKGAFEFFEILYEIESQDKIFKSHPSTINRIKKLKLINL